MALRLAGKRIAVALLIAASAFCAANVARAESVKLGLIDFALSPETLNSFRRVTVRSVTFAATSFATARYQSARNARAHGDVMTEELIKSFQTAAPGADLELYVASPFLEDPMTGKQVIDFDQLGFAYTWFARQGVKVVAQTFVSRDNALLEMTLRNAAKEGLVILTSAGNGPRQNAVPPYPARYVDAAIGISTTALQDELDQESDRNAYVRYSVPPPSLSPLKMRQNPESAALIGSSRATVAAAGYLGALMTRYRVETAADAMLLLDTVALPAAGFEGGAYGKGVLMNEAVMQQLRAPAVPPVLRKLERIERSDA